jgi:hypothetical protein
MKVEITVEIAATSPRGSRSRGSGRVRERDSPEVRSERLREGVALTGRAGQASPFLEAGLELFVRLALAPDFASSLFGGEGHGS